MRKSPARWSVGTCTLEALFADSSIIQEPDRAGLSYLFTGITESRKSKNKTGKLFALQNEERMKELDKHFWNRLFYGAVDKRLLESIHYVNDKELEIFNRGRSWAYRWQAVYGKESLYLPLKRLRGIGRDNKNEDKGIVSILLSTEASEHDFIFTGDNPALNQYRTVELR